MTAPRAASDRVELVATVLLALAAVATAWSSYQATRWNGEQAIAAGRANAARVEASRAQGLAEFQQQVDVATFIQWVDATAAGDETVADFYEQRFRPEFKPAFEAWTATDPLEDPDAPPTPFAMPEYKLSATTDERRADVVAKAEADAVHRNVVRASDYVLGVVLFATTLFFAGLSTRLTSPRVRWSALALGWVVFVGAVGWMLTFPVSFTV